MGKITRYWPFGPHGSVGNNLTGIGEEWRKLNSMGVPIWYKGADGYGPIHELWALEDRYGAGNQACFRLADKNGVNWDVPNWHAPTPQEAAAQHVAATLEALPPEFDKRTWLEIINEPDKDKDDSFPGWGSAEFANWLGEFMQEAARILVALGYKVAGFGFSSGEPEIPDWLTDGMVGYLKMCAENPDKVAIAVHEYSYNETSLEDAVAPYPWLLGRFTKIFEIADQLGLRRPTILVTEFGWSLGTLPGPTEAMEQLRWAAEKVYGPHPQVVFVAIWHFGSWFTNISNKAQRLIAPMGEEAETWRMEVDGPGDPPPPPPPPPEETDRQRRWRLSLEEQKAHGIQLAQTAIQEAIRQAGLHPVTKEMYVAGEPPFMAAEDWTNRDNPQPRRVFEWINGKVESYPDPTGDPPPPPPPPPPDEKTFHMPVYPVAGVTPYVTQKFANPTSYGYHEGLDLRVMNPTGRMPKIVSGAAGGIVERIRAVDPGSGYGIYVRIRYEGYSEGGQAITWKVWYCHLSQVAAGLSEGQKVVAGQELGLAGSTGNSTGPHLHLTVQKIPGGLPGYVIDSVVDPLPLIDDLGDPPPPPPPPPPNRLDLVPYFTPNSQWGPLYELRDNPSGAQRRVQTQVNGQDFFITKGTGGIDGKSEFEALRWDSEYIWRGLDTSPGNGRFYVQYEPGKDMARWCPRWMAPGESWSGPGHRVQFFMKRDCSLSAPNSGHHTNSIKFIARHDYKDWFGVRVNDVVELLAGEERFFFARGLGMVGWESPWNSSYISELHEPGTRPNNIREPVCSYSLP